MTIASYNINGIRSALRKGIADWIQSTGFDLYCFQELKANIEDIDTDIFEALSYYNFWFPAEKKGYSGVGIISKAKPDLVVYGIEDDKFDREGRVIRADYGDLSVISAYFPSGSSGGERQEYKMSFLDAFNDYVQKPIKTRPFLIISGDYNICHQPIDIHDPVRLKNTSGFLPEERAWVTNFLRSGFTDSFRKLRPEQECYSWWSYRAQSRAKNLGWRIDYNMISSTMIKNLIDADILSDVVHSDHCPVYLKINS